MSNPSPTSVAKLRVDQVGSLLRPQKIKDVYARHGNGEAGDEELRQFPDEPIEELIALQERTACRSPRARFLRFASK